MATNAEFPPYEYHEGDEVVGIDVDIASAIAEELGMELKVEDMAFDSIIPAVTSGKADIGAAGMTVTPDREESVAFTDTYAHATQVIIVKEDSDITGPGRSGWKDHRRTAWNDRRPLRHRYRGCHSRAVQQGL